MRAREDVKEIRPPRAVTFLKRWDTFSKPVAIRCEDGSEFVIKAANVGGKAVVAEQVIGRLGQLLGAPVPHITLVDVPTELIAAEPQMSHITPGLAHGAAFVPNCSERMGYEHAKEAVNRDRFASLAVLYGWALAGDHQLVYDVTTKIVWSVDHGHFFPGGPGWSEGSLNQGGAGAVPDPTLIANAGLTEADIRTPLEKLATISQIDIARAVASVPDGWPVTEEERVSIALFLDQRREQLASTLAQH